MTIPTTLATIRAEYAPYHTFAEFDEGFAAHAQRRTVNPYDPDSVAAQAWDRGLDAAAQYWLIQHRQKQGVR